MPSVVVLVVVVVVVFVFVFVVLACTSPHLHKTKTQTNSTPHTPHDTDNQACLMAGVNGAVLPVFSIVFTEMLEVFFMCTEIDFSFVPACNGTLTTFIHYNCDLDDLPALLDPFNVTAQQCFEIAERCGHTDLGECQADLLQRAAEFSGFFVLIGVCAALGILFQIYLFGIIGQNLTRRIRQASFQAILKQDIGFFDKEEHSTGSMTTKLAQDASVIEAAVREEV